MGKAIYAAGKTVTFRLRKTDQGLADYLNSLESPTDAIIDGITLKMKSDPSLESNVAGGVGDVSSLIPLLQNVIQQSLVQSDSTPLDPRSLLPIIEEAVRKGNEPILDRINKLEEAMKGLSLPNNGPSIDQYTDESAVAKETVQVHETETNQDEDDPDVLAAMEKLGEW
ncbi:hypothetical protein ABES02_29515 [Neobacillus pocheonensis]|uniref:hypothetical protein n=1 Tax=Neobacillus pocheonensis TaxID=363869 RepID=UPI003D2A89A5